MKPKLYLFIILGIFPNVLQGHGSESVQHLGKVRPVRQVCPHGDYEHEDRTCCKCPAGQQLTQHCTSSADDGKCEPCMKGTYNSSPNNQDKCLRCTSCSHENANLEVEKPCTIDRNTRCRCKKDHYCNSNPAETCKTCEPCSTCGVKAVQEACTDRKDTVCGGVNGAIIAVVVIGFLVAGIVLVTLWKKGLLGLGRHKQKPPPTNGPENSRFIEMEPLPVSNVKIEPLLPDISDVLGWKDMKHVAMRSGISDVVIESCKLDHQGDSQEQTLQLLKKWVERHGRDSASKLVQILKESERKDKAEKVRAIITTAASAR